MMSGVFAVVLSLAGVGCLFAQWQKQITSTWLLTLIGWGLLGASIIPWSVFSGAEFGLVYALSLPTCFAWILIAFQNRKAAQTKPASLLAPEKIKTDYRAALLNTGRIFVVLPYFMVVSVLVTILLVYMLPVSEDLQLLSALLITPTLWGSLAVWFSASERQWVSLVISFVITLLAGIYLFLLQ